MSFRLFLGILILLALRSSSPLILLPDRESAPFKSHLPSTDIGGSWLTEDRVDDVLCILSREACHCIVFIFLLNHIFGYGTRGALVAVGAIARMNSIARARVEGVAAPDAVEMWHFEVLVW